MKHWHICGGVGTGWESARSQYYFDPDLGCGHVFEHEPPKYGPLPEWPTVKQEREADAAYKKALAENHRCPKCGKDVERYRATPADLAAHRLVMYRRSLKCATASASHSLSQSLALSFASVSGHSSTKRIKEGNPTNYPIGS